ncbi:hypothetical protein [Mesorhizobium sp. SP-1A]|uniref:hypothetical protein n=1 Tax=Mesorhizobium sp. SP-1A TaxID=3077840 RepID=UPI0028F74DFF|nr:hypothetical protein [Mesorhizobium sp. SP-1A]
MQTISIPYRCSAEDRDFIVAVRRVYSAAVRTGYANAERDGKSLKEKELREFVKARFAGGIVDAWVMHCATLEARDLRKIVPDGSMLFGGRKDFERRIKGLIDKAEWKNKRLRPFCSRGDKIYAGNRHFKLSEDGLSCTFSMMMPRVAGQKMQWRVVKLDLAHMHGNAGEIVRQAAKLAAEKKINITFRIDDQKLHVTIDPEDLPDHPERRQPIKAVPGRALGVDLNPNFVGLSVVQNVDDPTKLSETELLEHQLVQFDLPLDASAEAVREALAKVCDRTIRLCRKWGIGLITFEKGLGKLRSGGKSKTRNRLINYWARSLLIAMMTRKARLCGIKVIEVWGGYSTTIGNLAFEVPDACASAAEIARRGLAVTGGYKDVLPAFEEGWLSGRWKDQTLPVECGCWKDVHQAIKTAKIGYRRPHPTRASVPDPRTGLSACGGYAVRRLNHRHRPGTVYMPVSHGHGLNSADNRFHDGNGKPHSIFKSG